MGMGLIRIGYGIYYIHICLPITNKNICILFVRNSFVFAKIIYVYRSYVRETIMVTDWIEAHLSSCEV